MYAYKWGALEVYTSTFENNFLAFKGSTCKVLLKKERKEDNLTLF